MSDKSLIDKIAELHEPIQSYGWCKTHDCVLEWCKPMRHTAAQKADENIEREVIVCADGCGRWPCNTMILIIGK